MTASITIRLATKEDRESLSRLFHAIEVHYWGADAPTQEAVSAHVDRDILNSGCEMAIAECDGVAVGLTTFALLYPAPDLGGQLLMKDLFVTSDARGRGIGRALLEYLARLAVQRGCVRLDWTAETDNPRALALYDSLGAKRVTEKVYFRVDGDCLKQWASDGAQRIADSIDKPISG